MKAPFKVLFSNDTTNILTCISPYHKRGDKFRPEMLEASVDETANRGIDVHLLQPGLGWIPWWKSKVYPFSTHVKFMKDHFGMDPSGMDGYSEYMASGGDIVGVFINRCRKTTMKPFVSLRLNDGHGHEFIAQHKREEPIPAWAAMSLSPIHVEHPEWRIGPNLSDPGWRQRSLNWAIPEVRRHKLSYIREIIEQYDIEGFELDFMRNSSFFSLAQTSREERESIMTDFVKEVRAMLDRTSAPGKHRWLCARVPGYTDVHHWLGLDLRRMADAGVEMFNITSGNGYFTEPQLDLCEIREMVPDASVYLEMCHNTREGPAVTGKVTYDSSLQRITTPRQYYTGAHLAYARKLDGVSAFNFVYYREHGIGTDKRGPFTEPPFEVFEHLGDPDWLARQSQQHYILADNWNQPISRHKQLSRTLSSGVMRSTPFRLNLAAPAGGWKRGGRLRIQSPEPFGSRKVLAVWNCVDLEPTEDLREPFEYPWTQLLGTREQHVAWTVPLDIIKDGDNYIDIRLSDGAPIEIVFLDVDFK